MGDCEGWKRTEKVEGKKTKTKQMGGGGGIREYSQKTHLGEAIMLMQVRR